jgi:hypothetical protein
MNKKKAGRPRGSAKPAHLKRTERLALYLTQAESKKIRAAANDMDLSLQDYIRGRVLSDKQ